MSVIRDSSSTRRALYRLVKVLKAKLKDELDDLNDTGNVIIIPDDNSYFVAATEQEMNKVLNASNAACFIYPLGPSTVTAPRSGDGNLRAKLHTTIVRVVFLFKKPAGYNEFEVEGKKQTMSETIFHFADRIMGAASTAIYKYAVNADDIHEVNIVSQYADLVAVNSNDLTGRAILEVEVLQDVLVPMPTYSIP